MALQASPHLQDLVNRHLSMEDEPLLLAIYYRPEREQPDIFLFEVVENFGAGRIHEDRELFEIVFEGNSGFPLDPGQYLHLVLTSPVEFIAAVDENWKHIEELKKAIEAGQYQVLYEDPGRPDLMERIHA